MPRTKKVDMTPTPLVMPAIDPQKMRRYGIILAAVAVVAVVLWFGRSLIIAGVVNNQPIWRWDVENRLLSRYGAQTMDELVNETLLRQEMTRQHVTVTPAEIDAKQAQIEKSLAGQTTLSAALASQGMSLPEFRQQLELQIAVDKLTANVASPSAQEVDNYISQNKDVLSATDEGMMRQQAIDAVTRDKKNTAFQKIFDDLKAKAKVLRTL